VTFRKSLDEIEVTIRSGAGVPVVCEGETPQDDEFILASWFSSQATAISFFAQNGWRMVVDAVNELRGRGCPAWGIVDRDFAPDEEIARQRAPDFDGRVFRLPRYDLESYLLDPRGWLHVVGRVHRREGTLPAGWDTEQAVADRVMEAFTDCFVLAAHNFAVHEVWAACRERPGFVERKYWHDAQAGPGRDPLSDLRAWADGFSAADMAAAAYEKRLAELRSCHDPEVLCRLVPGKEVLRHVWNKMPIPRNRKKMDLKSLQDEYLEHLPDPPSDVRLIVDRILENSRGGAAAVT
jgi:hypothetical protein